jgi:hypothetical protein
MLEVSIFFTVLIIIIITAIVILVQWVTKDMPECKGECNQGRTPCNCSKGNKNGI